MLVDWFLSLDMSHRINLGILFSNVISILLVGFLGFWKLGETTKEISRAIKYASRVTKIEDVSPYAKGVIILEEVFNREDSEGRFVNTGWKIPTKGDECYSITAFKYAEKPCKSMSLLFYRDISALNPNVFMFDRNGFLLIPKELIPVKFKLIIHVKIREKHVLLNENLMIRNNTIYDEDNFYR